MMLKVALGKRRITFHVDRMPGGGGYMGGVLWRRLRGPNADEATQLILSTSKGEYVMGKQ